MQFWKVTCRSDNLTTHLLRIGSFEGKTYMQLFQYLISKRSVSPPIP